MATGQPHSREDLGELEKEIVWLARRAFQPLKHIEQIDSLDDICPAYFFQLFEIILGETVPGWRETRNRRQEANVCQFLVNTLEDQVFRLPLDHITGEAIADGDPLTLKNLLEIFCELTDDFCRRSPLADISDAKSPKDRNRDLANAKDITEDPGFIAPEIRKLLARINSDAETIAQYSQSCGLLDAVKSGHSIREIFTQTTPVPMTSAVTSPITWDFILKKRELQNAEKNKTKPVIPSQPVIRKTIPGRAKTAVPSTKGKSMQKSLGPKRAPKPKPVLGSKLRRNSSSTMTKPMHSPVSKKSSLANKEGDTAKLLKLVEQTEKVIIRRREIAREIKRLQNEESILKTTESILKKELQYMQSKRLPTKPGRESRTDVVRGRARVF